MSEPTRREARVARELNANQTPNRFIPSRGVRLWLYGIAVAGAAVLVGYGVLTIEQGGLWLTLLGAVLGVSNAVAAGNVPSGRAE